jgi:hypothetical protein
MAKGHHRVPQELGSPALSTAETPVGDRSINSWPRARLAAATRRHEPSGQQPWYRPATGKELGERKRRESERLDSTDETGELVLDEDPAEGSGTSRYTTDVGNYDRCLET